MNFAQSLDHDHDQGVLHSWKDISSYTGRSVRTVQRWEQLFTFPVHRASGELKGSVMAFRSEIDAWLRSRALRPKPRHEGHERIHALAESFAENSRTLETRVNTLAEVIARTNDLRKQMIASRPKSVVSAQSGAARVG